MAFLLLVERGSGPGGGRRPGSPYDRLRNLERSIGFTWIYGAGLGAASRIFGMEDAHLLIAKRRQLTGVDGDESAIPGQNLNETHGTLIALDGGAAVVPVTLVALTTQVI